LGGHGLGQHHGRAEIDVEVGVPALVRQIADAVVVEDAGAVDQQGHRTKLRRDGGDQGVGVELGEIRGEGGGANTPGLQGLDGVVALVSTAMVDGDVIAGLGAGLGQGAADAADASGDQGDAATGHPD